MTIDEAIESYLRTFIPNNPKAAEALETLVALADARARKEELQRGQALLKDIRSALQTFVDWVGYELVKEPAPDTEPTPEEIRRAHEEAIGEDRADWVGGT
jgi:hypothetical protein